MKLTEAHFDLDGRTAIFRSDDKGNSLSFDVDDFDDAVAICSTLKRSRARKKANENAPLPEEQLSKVNGTPPEGGA